MQSREQSKSISSNSSSGSYSTRMNKMKPIPFHNDNLDFKHDPQIMNKLESDGEFGSNTKFNFFLEHLVFSCEVIKYNRFGMK